ncbi:MAG TPA: MBL fold metallo-hydrolase [Aliidongia sp.]|nr:MBL fold metallo-hydrolase [Aliidongia sp.]
MFDLVFLGTSASVPSPERSQPALLIAAAGRRTLVDCGEGTQRQLLSSGAGLRRLGRLLLTHGHLDHILGIPGLLSSLSLQERSDALTIHGGPHTLRLVANMLEALWGKGRAPIALEFDPLQAGPVAAEDGFTVDCFPVEHRDTDSFGFAFQSTARRHLRPERLAELHIPDDSVRKELAAGLPVRLADGRKIDPEEVLGPLTNGTRLVVVGDAGTTAGLADVVKDADALVIEATFLDRDAAIARAYGHLTAAEAATLAVTAGVKRLILNHISGRYGAAAILAEAREVFPATMIAADLDRFTL